MSRSLICAAKVVGNSEASNLEIGATPLLPSSKLQRAKIYHNGCCSSWHARQMIHETCHWIASDDGANRTSVPSQQGQATPVIECVYVVAKDGGNALPCDDHSVFEVRGRCCCDSRSSCSTMSMMIAYRHSYSMQDSFSLFLITL